MYFYPFHVTDYHMDTAHIDPLRDIVYRRMLDWMYLNEEPIPTDPMVSTRLLRLWYGPELLWEDAARVNWQALFEDVAAEFFVRVNSELEYDDEGGWYWHHRVGEELDKYRRQKKTAQENGKKGGRPKKEPDDNPEETQPVIENNPALTQPKTNQEPLTKNQEPIKKNGRFTPPTASAVLDYAIALNYSWDQAQAERFVDHYEANGWVQARGKPIKDWKAAVRNWEKNRATMPPGPQTGPGPDSGPRKSRDVPLDEFLNDRSWAE